jgi:copper oxidase (laccase) domain-containing protein
MKIFDEGGASEGWGNRRRMLERVGLTVERAALVRVSYEGSDYCQYAEAGEGEELRLDKRARRSDGLWTREQGRGLFLPVADCLPVVLTDETAGVLMVVHGGRQTMVQGGVARAVEELERAAGVEARELRVWLGPAAGKENYPLYEWKGMGLQEAAVEQLVGAGVEEGRIWRSEIDTTTDEWYWSHSCGDTKERFAVVAVMR